MAEDTPQPKDQQTAAPPPPIKIEDGPDNQRVIITYKDNHGKKTLISSVQDKDGKTIKQTDSIPVTDENDYDKLKEKIDTALKNPEKKKILFEDVNSDNWKPTLTALATNGTLPKTADEYYDEAASWWKMDKKDVKQYTHDSQNRQNVKAFHDELSIYRVNGAIPDNIRPRAGDAALAALEDPSLIKTRDEQTDYFRKMAGQIATDMPGGKDLKLSEQDLNQLKINLGGDLKGTKSLQTLNESLTTELMDTEKYYDTWKSKIPENDKAQFRLLEANKLARGVANTAQDSNDKFFVQRMHDSLAIMQKAAAADNNPELGKILATADALIDPMVHDGAKEQYYDDKQGQDIQSKAEAAYDSSPGSRPPVPENPYLHRSGVRPGTVVPAPQDTVVPPRSGPLGRQGAAGPSGARVQLASLSRVTPVAAASPTVTRPALPPGSHYLTAEEYAEIERTDHFTPEEQRSIDQYNAQHGGANNTNGASQGVVSSMPQSVQRNQRRTHQPTGTPTPDEWLNDQETTVVLNNQQLNARPDSRATGQLKSGATGAATPATTPAATSPTAQQQSVAHKPGEIWTTPELDKWNKDNHKHLAYRDGQIVDLDPPQTQQMAQSPMMGGYNGYGPNRAGLNIGFGVGVGFGGVGPYAGTPDYTLYNDHTRYNTRQLTNTVQLTDTQQITGGLHISSGSVTTRFNPGPRR